MSDAAATLKAERKRVVRHFQPYTSEQRADHAASHRLGHRQRQAMGEYFYTHPDVPGVCFDTRQRAADAGIRARQQPATLGAFRGCECSGRHLGINYAAVMEWTGPGAITKILDAAERKGTICAVGQDCPADRFAVLDLLDKQGDVVADRCIPDRAAWQWWVRAIELRATSSDCPTCEPDAYRATYGVGA